MRNGKSQMSQIKLRAPREAALFRNFRRWDKKTRNLVLFVSFFLPMSVYHLPGQESSKPLSPTEAYKAALAPFNQTRSQSNDLTDADRFALSIGIAQSSRDCLALSSDVSSFSHDAKELFALGQLCIFGQQFEPARAAFVEYLALPQPPQREQALSLLVRAFLGLNVPASAEAQVSSLLRDYPYDALIHVAIDQVIDNSEGASPFLNDMALKLCATQSAATVPLLTSGKALEGKEGAPRPPHCSLMRCDAPLWHKPRASRTTWRILPALCSSRAGSARRIWPQCGPRSNANRWSERVHHCRPCTDFCWRLMASFRRLFD